MWFKKEILFAIAFVLCAGGKNVLATEPTISQFCSLVQNGELLANPTYCNYYYQCLNGVAYSMQCASGYYFAKDSQACLPQNQVNCAATTTNTTSTACLNQVVGSLVTYSGNCNAYYICTINGAQIGYCATNYNFNPTLQQCQAATVYPCTSTDTDTTDSLTDLNPCDYMQNGVAFQDPLSCQNWYMCQSNVLTRGTCPTNYGFNVTTGICIYNTTCIGTTDNTDSLPIGTLCTQIGQTTAVANSCTYYYTCNGVQYILNQCPNNLYYDTVSGSCVSQLNARNNCDRCVGNTLTFVNTYSTTDCTNYTYCVNGVANYTGTCPSGAYFNQVAGACQANVPEPAYGCCNPTAVYGTTTTL